MTRNHLLILTGPSCVGKSPLVHTLARMYPEWWAGIRTLILYNSRQPRPGERDGHDYHFRQRPELAAMQDNPRFVSMDVRGDFQVLDVEELLPQLESSPVLFEGNPFIARVLQEDERLVHVPKRSIFLSPLSRAELADIEADEDAPPIADAVAEVMRRKLIRRTERQKGELEPEDLETIYERSHSAWREICMAPLFDCVVVNHDGEDSDNWSCAPVPIGEARQAVEAVYAALSGKAHRRLESWQGALA
ncbi:MAG: hypothetical protein AB3N64_15435 [Puniceicoccaceae bacterium]